MNDQLNETERAELFRLLAKFYRSRNPVTVPKLAWLRPRYLYAWDQWVKEGREILRVMGLLVGGNLR